MQTFQTVRVFCLLLRECDAITVMLYPKPSDLLRHLNANRSKSNIKPTKNECKLVINKSFNFRWLGVLQLATSCSKLLRMAQDEASTNQIAFLTRNFNTVSVDKNDQKHSSE